MIIKFKNNEILMNTRDSNKKLIKRIKKEEKILKKEIELKNAK